MQRISSGSTFFFKRIFPVVWFGLLSVFLAVSFMGIRPGGGFPVPVFLLPVVVMAGLGFFLMKKFVVDLVDEVWDGGDVLVVKWKGLEERIPFAEIINVSYSAFTNPKRATLTLRHPGLFGKEVTFCPLAPHSFSSRNPLIEDLIERIDRKRRMVNSE